MKRCIKDQEAQDYPDVKPGDTVENINGEVYLVCRASHDYLPPMFLQNLEDGNIWSSESTWGTSLRPEHWKKVNYCFKEV